MLPSNSSPVGRIRIWVIECGLFWRFAHLVCEQGTSRNSSLTNAENLSVRVEARANELRGAIIMSQ
jgi:hypothetical protein